MGHVAAVVGAQFGSEGKGLIVEKIAGEYDVHVRTGAPNAGHTYYIDVPDRSAHPTGNPHRQKVVARSVPVGACNPRAKLVVGAGALIDVNLLIEEVEQLDALGLNVSHRLYVDRNAMCIDPTRHHQFEGGVEGYAHAAIGSTGEGVGPARMAKIVRTAWPSPAPAWTRIDKAEVFVNELSDWCTLCDTAVYVNEKLDFGSSVLLEGTQGSGLSLTHGAWPYVTSSDTNAAQLAVDAGIAPQMVKKVILVARTTPIRVAGNSGPLPNETTWEALGKPEEHTTVTKKVRRVGRWNTDTVRRAVMLNRPTEIALTFTDYIWPELANMSHLPQPLSDGLSEWLSAMNRQIGVPITRLGTGPDSVIKVTGFGSAPLVPRGPWPTHEDVFGC